jgi:hypothetical protein
MVTTLYTTTLYTTTIYTTSLYTTSLYTTTLYTTTLYTTTLYTTTLYTTTLYTTTLYTTSLYTTTPYTTTLYTTTLYTTSSLDSLQNLYNHAYLVEEIRKKVASLERCEWKIMFSWAKTHVGIHGNELADRLAKEAARNDGTSNAFNRIPKSTLYYEAAEEAK